MLVTINHAVAGVHAHTKLHAGILVIMLLPDSHAIVTACHTHNGEKIKFENEKWFFISIDTIVINKFINHS